MNAPVYINQGTYSLRDKTKYLACFEKRKYEMGFHISFEAFLYSSIKFSINLFFLKSDECVVFVFVPNILMVLKCQQLRFE